MKTRFHTRRLGFGLLLLAASALVAPAADRPLKVYVLARQSNMQGHARVSTLPSLADDPKTAPLLQEVLGPNGKPKVCERVWISSVGCLGDAYTDLREKNGKLTAGFGPGTDKFGPEFTFGLTLEKHLNEPVLIIKTAWGGRIMAPIGKAFAEALLPTPAAPPKAAAPAAPAAAPGPVKVFVLAGQSNMEGHGFVPADPRRNGGKGSLEYLVKDAATAGRFKHLVGPDGKWAVRDDVWVHYLDRKGKLTAGFGVKEDRIGPELGFGHVVGDAYADPVLLVKLCWGGKSLAKDFRPPSSGGEVGPYYTEIVTRTKAVLANLPREFPEFAGRGHELAGFGWHQGWNDRVNQAFNDEYEANMVNFIRDVRKVLGVKDLPFVIAETGMGGPEEKHPRALSLMKAQAAAAARPEFQGNVAFVGTKELWRDQSVSPSGQNYHWNTNAETYYLIGEAMGKAMTRLRDRPAAK
jgi:alpha-galactosidase